MILVDVLTAARAPNNVLLEHFWMNQNWVPLEFELDGQKHRPLQLIGPQNLTHGTHAYFRYFKISNAFEHIDALVVLFPESEQRSRHGKDLKAVP